MYGQLNNRVGFSLDLYINQFLDCLQLTLLAKWYTMLQACHLDLHDSVWTGYQYNLTEGGITSNVWDII